jgi:nickel and cobalt resistance protein CnrR
MISARRAIIWTVILAFLAGVSGAFVGTKLLTPNTSQDNALHAILHSELNLSKSQDENIANEERRFARVRAQLKADAHNANVALANAIQSSKRDGPEVRMATEYVHQTLGRYQKETISHIFRMRAVLTPKQAEIFDRSVAQALIQEPQ